MKKYNSVYSRFAAVNMVEEDGKLWMALLDRNGICEVDKVTRQAKIRKLFEDELLSKEFLYGKTEKVGDNLIFAPWMAEKIAIYNLKSDTMQYIPLKERPQRIKEGPYEAKFWNVMRYQSTVYLLGYSYPAIIKINTDLSVEYITDWVEKVEENIEEGDLNGYFGDGYVIVGDLALFPVGCVNAVLELNLKTEEVRLRKLNISMKGVGGIASADKENMWLVGRRDRTNWLSCWNIRTNEIKEIQLFEEDGNIVDPFYAPMCIGFKMFLIPLNASCIYEMNIYTGEIMKCKWLEISDTKWKERMWPYWKTMAPMLRGRKLCYVTSADLRWHEYDVITKEHETYFVKLEETERYFAIIYEEYKEKNTMIPEIKIPLECFLDETGKVAESEKKERYLVGKNIYDRIGEELGLWA